MIPLLTQPSRCWCLPHSLAARSQTGWYSSSTPRDGHVALLLATPTLTTFRRCPHLSLRLPGHPLPTLLFFAFPHHLRYARRVSPFHPPPPSVLNSAAIPSSSIRCPLSSFSHIRQPTLQSRRRPPCFVRPGCMPPPDSVLSLSHLLSILLSWPVPCILLYLGA